MSDGAWAFFGILVTQAAILVGVVVGARRQHRTSKRVADVAFHVNNVEEDIDHDQGPTLGQRLRRMETNQEMEWAENRRVHSLILDGRPTAAIAVFKQSYLHDPHPAYHSVWTPETVPPWNVEWVNAAWTELTGLDAAGAGTHQYVDAIHPDDRHRVLASAQQSYERGIGLAVEYRHRHAVTGEWVTVVVHAEPYFTPAGKAIGQLGVMEVVQSEHVSDPAATMLRHGDS